MSADRAGRSAWRHLKLFGSALVALALGLAITFGGTALRVLDPPELRLARELVFDEYQHLSPRDRTESPVRIVDIDESSLRTLGQWPWPRSEIARLVDRLSELGAAVIAFDMIFPEPDRLSPAAILRREDLREALPAEVLAESERRLPDFDRLLADAMRDKPVVLGFAAANDLTDRRPALKAGMSQTGESALGVVPRMKSASSNLSVLEEAAAGIGAIALSPLEVQGVARRIPLLWSDGRHLYPSLVLEILRVAQGERGALVHGTPRAPAAVTAVAVGAVEIPTTAAGELRVHFGRERADRYVSAARVLDASDDEALRPLVENQIIIVGASAAGLFDWRVTTLGESVPGVSVHAQALEQILSGAHISRPDWADPLEVALILAIGIVLTLVAMSATPLGALVLGGGVAMLIVAGAWAAFKIWGVLVDPVLPSSVGLAVYLVLVSFRYFVADREKRFVRRAFARYLAPAYLAEIERDPSSLRLGGEEREITILFLDIRGFTSLSERLSPREVVEFLNILLGRLSEDILAEGGTIDKYIGDSIMAFWNAPVRQADHAARACRAALRMRDTVRGLNETDAFRFRAREEPLPDVAIGIGINTGPALVGNMGSEIRFDYSVVGDTVNVAARVESQSKVLGTDIVTTGAVARAAPDLAWIEGGLLALKGKTDKERLFVLAGPSTVAASESFRLLAHRHAALVEAIDSDPLRALGEAKACHVLAERHVPVLEPFYRLLPTRLGLAVAAPGEGRRKAG